MMKAQIYKAAIYGTVVADAAALGLHWIYSQGKIASIVKKNAGCSEFLEPLEENYKGVPSFFAHPKKQAGDCSNYGSYILLLFKSMQQDEGQFSFAQYARSFQEFYGIGGDYVGYADTPMRETIFNITKNSKELQTIIKKTPSPLSDEKKGAVASTLARYFFECEPGELRETVKNMLKLYEFSREELASADELINSLSGFSMKTGIDDDQMPGLTRSAVFAWLYPKDKPSTKPGFDSLLAEMLDKAVRFTNDNDLCRDYALFMSYILADLYENGSPDNPSDKHARLKTLIENNLKLLPPKSIELIHKAMSYDSLNYRETTKTFGAACHVDMAIPLSIHILLNTQSYEEVVRTNILASGDSCGRAIFIGAVAGALYGVGGERGIPQNWIDKTVLIPVLESLHKF